MLGLAAAGQVDARTMNTGSRRKPTAKLTLLRRVPALRGCTDAQLREIESLVDEIAVPSGHQLTAEAATAHEAFVIVEGWAAVMIGGEPVAALGPGEFVGEMALLDEGCRTATVVAKTPMVLLVVSTKAFGIFIDHPAIARGLSRTLAERLRRADAARTPASEG